MKKEEITIEKHQTKAILRKTERLTIRYLREGDYDNWLSGFENRKASQYKYDEGKQDMSECTRDWFRDLVSRHQKFVEEDEQYIFGVFRQDDGKCLGMVNVGVLMRYDFHWADIGYSIHNQYWNKGYGKEAVEALIDICFTECNLHRVEAHINLDNGPSKKLAQAVGLKLEGTREKFTYEFGDWQDNLVYYKINENWKDK